MKFDPLVFLQELIRFNTTNPPGQERACILFIKEVLESFGIDCQIYSKNPNRPNLVSTIKGSGEHSPLLFYGHVDVVPANKTAWSHDPFAGVIQGGKLFGRGTLDMKGGLTMLIANFIAMSKESLTHDLILTVVSDEEVAGEYGSAYLVNEYADLFTGVKHALGEFGGFPLYLNGKKIYVIQVAEKQVCWLELRITGQGGHAALPFKGGVLQDLAQILLILNEHPLPRVENELVLDIFTRIAKIFDYTQEGENLDISSKEEAEKVIALTKPYEAIFSSLLGNTVNVTTLRAGTKTNVIPKEVTLELDGRLLPGQKPEQLIESLSSILSLNREQFSVLNYVENPQQKVDWTLFPLLADTIADLEPDVEVIPLMLGASTDARHFAKLGIQTYGFLPMNFSPDFHFFNKIHGVDECIPLECLEFGIDSIKSFLRKYSKQ